MYKFGDEHYSDEREATKSGDEIWHSKKKKKKE